MSYATFGWLAGMALALVVVVAVPSLDVWACVFLGFGGSMLGLLIGRIADGARVR